MFAHALAAPSSSPAGLSLTGKKWKLSRDKWREGAALSQATGLPAVITHILAQRGYGNIAQAEAFLNPRFDHLPDPSTLKDMDNATQRLAHAIQTNEPMAIFGDYDVDGACATALLTRYLRTIGINPEIYIPDRLTEGYGPSPEAMQKLAAQGVKLVITVDTGISGYAALQEAAKLGLTVIVTDHHPGHLPLPPAAAIVNPNRPDDTSALATLCGTGVVFYLLMSLNRHFRSTGWFNTTRPEPKLGQWLDLVALATVCDVMQLTGANRLLVARGLQQLGTWTHRGLATLATLAGVKDAPTASTLGFALGPRLNAAGRLDSAMAALNLLLADTDHAAQPLAMQLERLNRQRQEVEKQAVLEAITLAETLLNDNDPALVIANPAWHPGVVGLVASRVKERTGRPVFALGGSEGKDGQPVFKGSGRGLDGLNLGDALQSCTEILISGGGHAMAAGVTLCPTKLEDFRARLNAHLCQQITKLPGYDPQLPPGRQLATTLTLDATVVPASLNSQLAATLNQLAPFGNGNPEPLLALEKAQITYAKPVGTTQEHLKLRLKGLDGSAIDAIAFGAMNSPLGPALCGKTPLNGPLTLAGHLRTNRFAGTEKLDFQIVDAHTGFEAL